MLSILDQNDLERRKNETLSSHHLARGRSAESIVRKRKENAIKDMAENMQPKEEGEEGKISSTSTSTSTDLIPSPSPSTATTKRMYLMAQKSRVIQRLETLGYDPYMGVFVAHRKYLMQEKKKVIERLLSLGIDPYTGERKEAVEYRKWLIQQKPLPIDPWTGVESKS